MITAALIKLAAAAVPAVQPPPQPAPDLQMQEISPDMLRQYRRQMVDDMTQRMAKNMPKRLLSVVAANYLTHRAASPLLQRAGDNYPTATAPDVDVRNVANYR